MVQQRFNKMSALCSAVRPEALLLPETQQNQWQTKQIYPTWAHAAHALRSDWLTGTPCPSAGELAGATAIQAASACVIEAHIQCIDGYDERVRKRLLSPPFEKGYEWNIPEATWLYMRHLIVGARLENPALRNLKTLHGDSAGISLQITQDKRITKACSLEAVLPPFDESLGDILRAPARYAPHSLEDQLQYIRENWVDFLEPGILELLLLARDVLDEEFRSRGGGGGRPEGDAIHAPDLWMGGEGHGHEFPEEDGGFSHDHWWMTDLVLMAKHSNVWLDQLSKEFGRTIQSLNDIPDEALDRLASRGFTGLWLIGLWERSPSSRKIKQIRGNHEADASAYAVADYQIAGRFGGEEALNHLRERAKARGIRLAADMVPNHFGLDSTWMAEHPERFLQVPYSPFPGYQFTGENLSSDDRFQVYIEDGYWTESDAAVVFKRVCNGSGESRYIYHGNDGTQMPWNDTAQLDYGNPHVREAIIQVILDVARRFPIIRFDAAMTLAKRHIQRLWFPTPGSGGAIPSRAEHSMTNDDFHQMVPREFWREVVDRVAEEVPDTLLLAEAFWMMEAYFVRNLGMHRVYNSAFMHMLRNEDNARYRAILKDTLSHNPSILQRFVNFMNNPDEDTAVEQFGRGQKYFGVTTLMSTLPGLPMFGHGQLEGYAEKYGMEFTRAQWDEPVDEGLLAYHDDVIVPLLRQRTVYGSTEHFNLFDVYAKDGNVVESVYAFTNRGRDGQARSLVVFNNCHESVSGWVHTSVPVNRGLEEEPRMECVTITDALGLSDSDGALYGIRELRSNLWFLRKGADLAQGGMFFALDGYEAQVYTDVRALHDSEGAWMELHEHLGGRGVADLDKALDQLWRGPSCNGMERSAGVLLHPSSLPGPEGIGTLGQEAHDFMQWLVDGGFQVWQMLPLCQAGPGHSPYSSPASFIGNPMLIDLRSLASEGLLKTGEINGAPLPTDGRVDFDELAEWKSPLLRKAARAFLSNPAHPWTEAFAAYRAEHAWLDDTVLFLALSREQATPWWEWPKPLRLREEDALLQAKTRLANEIDEESALAFFFDMQWNQLRGLAEEKNISLLGDLPLYVSRDSADVWNHQELFELDENALPIRVAAVPPDAFSDSGQLWGNPLYRWDLLKETGYQWWLERMKRAIEWTPMVRLDHFRGFSAYYAVNSEDDDARNGKWIDGPGMDFFNVLQGEIGEGTLIAEDLGDIDDRVHELRAEAGYLCMRVLQFGFGGEEDALHSSEQCPIDSVVYTGTHDNNTTGGWWNGLTEPEQKLVVNRLNCPALDENIVDALVEDAMSAEAILAVIPAQDILRLGAEARMNTPGTGDGNWGWRLGETMTPQDAQRMRSTLKRHRRTA